MTVVDLSERMGAQRAMPYRRVLVAGGGAWGAALAAVAARAGREVVVWARRPELAAEIDCDKRNRAALGDIALPETIRATADLVEAARGADAALLVVPSVAIRETARALAAVLPAGAPVVLCAKGIERETGLLMSQVVASESPGRPVAVLSGPSFAEEVARDLPTAVTIASDCAAHQGEASVAARLALSLGTERFRPYLSDDMTGAEVGGTVKNVIAIACGMAQGAGFGSNARAALITRGLDEIKTLADALGGRRETVTGLSGMGDLMLTASSTQSRNFSYGEQIGRRVPPAKLFGGRPVVVEGIENALSVTDLARRLGVRMPICEAVRAVIHEGESFSDMFERLWTAPLESEPRALDLELAHPAAAGEAS
ncbi:MAG: NAD(P)H-dependent glycerol-3-phosphate dehydrogenase [Rubrimonas sp.]|uniref:NAD(P)H-dependent glycerol-3-phosphate dehydrogenase n=1 Tax=Rubrimonas sp. TaxID=2036015 RepID=UPI002FDE74AA